METLTLQCTQYLEYPRGRSKSGRREYKENNRRYKRVNPIIVCMWCEIFDISQGANPLSLHGTLINENKIAIIMILISSNSQWLYPTKLPNT